MNQQKGFSLIEVLVSLMLVTTLALALLEQQWQTKILLNQLVIRAEASNILDQIDETLLSNVNETPTIPLPYHFNLSQSRHTLILRLNRFNDDNLITRTYHTVGHSK